MYVKPTRGIVLLPDKKYREMPENGIEIDLDKYYRRLLRIGDITKATKPRSKKRLKKINSNP